VQTAEQRLERQAQIEADVALRKAELETATRAEEAVAASLNVAETEAADAADAEHAAATERSRRESELAAAVEAERLATDALGQLSSRLSNAARNADRSELEKAVADAQAAANQSTATLEGARRELALIDAQLADGDVDAPAPVLSTGPASIEELEWYLLSRLAAQRSVSYAGSVPLVLDDALAEIHGPDLVHLLSRLERMSTAVQVVVVSESDESASWADSIGTDRAMTLYPLPG
jgi:hypothetical protein